MAEVIEVETADEIFDRVSEGGGSAPFDAFSKKEKTILREAGYVVSDPRGGISRNKTFQKG